MKAIGRILGQDPGLVTRLLKVANSPGYGYMRQIDTISRAIVILDAGQIHDMLFSTITAEVFDGSPREVNSVADFWYHSLNCADGAGRDELGSGRCRTRTAGR